MNAKIETTSGISCNPSGKIIFVLTPIAPAISGNVVNIQINSTTPSSTVLYPSMGTLSKFELQGLGFVEYKVVGKFTVQDIYNNQHTYDFQSVLDLSNNAVQFNSTTTTFTHPTTDYKTISVLNPVPGLTYKWYLQDPNGLAGWVNSVHTGTSHIVNYGGGAKLYVVGLNSDGCTTSVGTAYRTYSQPPTTYTPGDFSEEYPNRAIDHYTVTQFCNSENPNLIIPTRTDGSTEGLKWSWYPYAFVSNGNNYVPENDKPLDLNYLKDGKLEVTVYDDITNISAMLKIDVFGSKEQYKGRNTCENELDVIVWDGLVVFKQANLDNDAWNKQLWTTIDRMNPDRRSPSNFWGIDIEIKPYTKVQVLSGFKAFNRIVLDEYSKMVIAKGCTLTSSCNMWGGIIVEDQCDLLIKGTKDNNVQIRNANTGVFVLEEYLLVDDTQFNPTLGNYPMFSEEFPFRFHNNDIDTLGEPLPCSKSTIQLEYVDFRNNYFHFYAMNIVEYDSYIKNSTFSCDPYEMIAPYQPQVINGEEVVFQTEACIVGFMHYRALNGFFETQAGNTFSNGGVQFSNNTFSDAFYGILMPGANYFNEPNTFKNIDKCAIRYFYYICTEGEAGKIVEINNQDIQLRAVKDPALEYQDRELSNVWNKINGFDGPARYYDQSSNLARHGLSTGFLKIQNQTVDPNLQIGIFVNNDYNSAAYETSIGGPGSLTGAYGIVGVNYFYPASFHNNRIVRTGFEDVFEDQSQKAYGIYSGYTNNIINNHFEGLTVGAFLHQGIGAIKENQFISCNTGINIKNQLPIHYAAEYPGFINVPVGLRLECNLFEPFAASNTPQVGLNLESGHMVGYIGTPPTFDYQRGLAGNVWPTAANWDRSELLGDDVHDVWTSPTNWTSIKNNNTGTRIVNYYRFKNEFVGTTVGNVDRDRAEFEGFATKAYTTANGFTPPVGSSAYMRICDNSGAAGQIYFPTPFISNDGSINQNKGNIQVATQENGLLVSSKDISTIESIQLFDITGRLLISNKEIKNISTQVPLEGIRRGTYILKVLNSNGEVFSTKVIY